MMRPDPFRWVLPDLNSALTWCKTRNDQGICCTLDVLGEDVKTEEQISQSIASILDCARILEENQLDAAIAIKPTSLGAIIDKTLARENIFKIYSETEEYNINLELDMEGTPLVEFTRETAKALAAEGYYVTLALQAYLDRTPDDIKTVLEQDITIRLVKGAYMGDTTDFGKIQEMYKNCFNALLAADQYFSVCTHDPEIIGWIMEQTNGQKEVFEFGFLKGLADETKLDLVKDGWQVSEYVPFGMDSKAYIMRRERYLKMLEAAGRTTVR